MSALLRVEKNDGEKRASFLSRSPTLWGRKKEKEFLNQFACQVSSGGDDEKASCQVVFVHGPSGSGKTSLCLELRSTNSAVRPYFLLGKFDQYDDRSSPCPALVQAFDSLLDEESASLKDHIQQSLHEEAWVLTRLVPSFQEVFGDQQSQENGGEMKLASERLIVAFLSFLRAFCSPDFPVILVIDDLQWADPSSLAVLQALVASRDVANLLVIGIYRDEAELSSLEPLFREIQNKDNMHDLPLPNLNEDELNSMISEVLSMEAAETKELTSLIHRKTDGNPFFAREFLTMIKRNELLKLNYGTLKWQWDTDAIQEATLLADNVATVLSNRMLGLPKQLLWALQIAACLGFVFDSTILEHLMKTTDLVFEDSGGDGIQQKDKAPTLELSFSNVLERAMAENFIEENGLLHRFTHDKLQQTMYELIPKGRRSQLHWDVGRSIQNLISTNQSLYPRFLLLATDQLNRGSSCIGNDEERRTLVRLNYEAILVAKQRNGVQLIGLFLDSASTLIQEKDWNSDFELMIDIRTLHAEYAVSRRHPEEGIKFVEEILKRAKHPKDIIAALTTRSQIQFVQNEFSKSIKDARTALILCGERLPPSNVFRVILELQRTKRLIKGKTDEELLNLTEIKDEKKVMALKNLLVTALCGWTVDPFLIALSYLKMFRITLKFGRSQYMPTAFAGFGCLAADAFEDAEMGCRFAELALRAPGKGADLPSTTAFSYCFALHYKLPLASLLAPLLSGYRKGLEIGDSVFGQICLGVYCDAYRSAGLRLDTFASDLPKFASQLKILESDFMLGMISPNMQLALNLTERSDDPLSISWEVIKKHGFFSKDAKPHTSPPAHLGLEYAQLFNAYILRDAKVAEACFKRLQSLPTEKDRRFQGYHFNNYYFVLVDGLVAFWLDRVNGNRRHRRIAENAIKWFKKKPNLNTVPLRLLLEAEKASMSDSNTTEQVMQKYNKVIAMITRSGLVHYAAMANEQAAEFLFQRHDTEGARPYLERALELYTEWTAIAKSRALVQTYPFLHNAPVAKAGFHIRGREQFRPNVDAASSSLVEGLIQ